MEPTKDENGLSPRRLSPRKNKYSLNEREEASLSPYLTYNERRQRNIQRNQIFLNSLFSSPNHQENDENNLKERQEIIDINPHDHLQNIQEISQIIQQKISSRNDEIMRILEYLEPSFQRAPALLIYGPTGVGKSFVCEACLAETKAFPIVHFSCSRATNAKKFWNDLWNSLIHSITTFNHTNFSYSPPLTNDQKKLIPSFSVLTTKIQSILKRQEKFLNSIPNTVKIPGIIMVFDEIHTADMLEEGLTQKLLTLGKDAATNIKVIGIQRSPPDRCLGHLHLPFGPYSLPQLISIIDSRLGDYNPAGSYLTEQQKQQFLTLTRDAIHFITFRSHNIDEIWATLTSLWEKYYTSNEIKLSPKFLEIEISSIFRQPTFHTLDVSLIPKDSTTSSSSGTILKRNLSVHSNDSMDSNVSSMMKPSLNFNSVINQNTLLGSQWYKDLPLIEKSLLLASYLASNNPQETDSTTFGTALKGRKKRLRAGQDPDEDTNIKENVVSPRTFGLERLLAIYTQILPSTSFQTISTLWWHPAATRSHQTMTDTCTSHVEGNKSPAIYEIEQKLRYYGQSEPHIYMAINSLIHKQHLLVHSSGTSTKNQYVDSTTSMVYYCTLNLENAEDLARSISFPLRDYLCT